MTESPTPTFVRSVYVHAPFCARRCPYCDFAVTVRARPDARDWEHVIRSELALVEEEGVFALDDALSTLYVGGGTPSLLGPRAMAGLGDALGRSRLASADFEWTAEANPESFTEDVARGWVAAGVNRISLGVQSFHEGTLRWMGRLHGAEGARTAVRIARAVGVSDVSVDLIFALPDRLGRDWRADLDAALGLDVPHISLYGLTVEPGTPLGRAVAAGSEARVDEARYEEEFLLASDVLTREGYEQYELSNFARDGARSRHNSAYWRGVAYLGLGNGAHSYAPPLRRWNVRAWADYRAKLIDGTSPVAGSERVAEDAARLESIWLGLRTAEGVRLDVAAEEGESRVEGWVGAGLATRADGRMRLTPTGWLVLDGIAVDLEAVWRRRPDGSG